MKRVENKNLYIQLLLSVVLLGILGVVSNYYFQKISIEHQTLYQVPNYEKRFNEYIDSEAHKINSYLELVKEKKELQNLFKSSNSTELYEKSKIIFDHLNTNSDITHFYFMKPNGEVLLRVHDKFRFSDIVNRYTFLKSKEKMAPFYGLEFGLKKNYTLRVVHPWIVDGELIGFVEIGKEVDKVIDSLSKQLGIEIYFAVKKSAFDSAPTFVQQRLNKTYKTDSQYVVYKTNKIPKDIDWLINGKDRFSWVEIGDQVFISHKNTLNDVSGEDLGAILYLVNITKEYNEFITTIWRYGIIMVLGTFFMLIIGYSFARTSQKKINSILRSLEKEKNRAENLAEEQKHLLSLFDKGDSILFKWHNDAHWNINYVSDNVSKLLEYSKTEFLNKNIVYSSCIHKDDINHVSKEVEYAIEHNLDFFKHDPYRVITKAGKIKWVIDYTVTQKDASGSIKYFIGYISDITNQIEQEHAIRDKLQKFMDTQNSIVLLSNGKSIIFTNKKFLEYFGYEDLEDFKKDYECICERFVEHDNFFHLGKVKEGEANWIESLLNISGRQRIVSMVSHDSEAHAFSVSINEYENDEYVVTFTDISDTMLEKLELKKEATVDVLTQLYNRVYFSKNIEKILGLHQKNNMKTGVIFFDIDHFKEVNDNYGHDVGDYVLNKLALLVKKYTRDDDKIIRWGGEEFLIIIEADTLQTLYKIAEHLRSVIEKYEFKDVHSITCSFGCAIHDNEDDILTTVKKADEKLYIAKESGRNRVEY